jgi:rubrerythrin
MAAVLIDLANRAELASIAKEIGADVLEGALRYPSESEGWPLSELGLSEYLDFYRGKRLVLIIVPVGEAEPETYTCGICGFVMSDVRACPR